MISELIKPIKLLSGSHKETAETGQGCFMNVIAYLNGEPQITDSSDCVCLVVRPIAIFLNDFLKDEERYLLIPYIERAMGSAIKEKIELVRRANLVVNFAEKCKKIGAEYAKYAEYAAKYAEYAAKSAEYAAKSAEYAAKSAEYAAEYAESAAEYRKEIIDASFEFLDKALPKKVIHEEIVMNRAIKFVELTHHD